MKVYLSARYARREELCRYREQLAGVGIECTARWLDGEGDDLGVNATIDVEDVLRADVLVNFTDEPAEFSSHPWASRGGRHVEVGIAIGAGIPVVIVGPRENIFHHLASVVQVGCIETLVDALDDGLPPRDAFAAAVVSRERPTRDRLDHAAFGLMSEAGELAALMKRAMVHHVDVDPLDILDEIGDAQYYSALALDSRGLTLRAAQAWIVIKLRSRAEYGKDKGRERALLEQFAKDWGIR